MNLHFLSDNAVDSLKKVLDKNPTRQISLAVENMLKTGRLFTQTGLDLQQVLNSSLCLFRVSLVFY